MSNFCNQAKGKLVDVEESAHTFYRVTMRSILRKIAALLLMSAILVWLIGGARLGFPIDQEQIATFDPITEIESTDWHPKFLPGVESLALGVILGGSLFLVSFLFRANTHNEPNQ